MKQLAGVIIFMLVTNTVLEYVIFPLLLHISVHIVVYFLVGVIIFALYAYLGRGKYVESSLVNKALRESK